jgi:trans-aconitate methyltransferase
MINEKLYWEDRYKNGHGSGYGSYGVQLVKKLGWIKALDGISSISEYGCGDFNFGKRVMELFPSASYTGTDLSELIVEKNQRLYPFAKFTTELEIPPADLVMCVDVVFHIFDEGELNTVLNKLDRAWTKYLVLTAYERDADLESNHVKIRKFNPERFGSPILREIIEEDGSLYFYIFKK